jgi:hypothetical protein
MGRAANGSLERLAEVPPQQVVVGLAHLGEPGSQSGPSGELSSVVGSGTTFRILLPVANVG